VGVSVATYRVLFREDPASRTWDSRLNGRWTSAAADGDAAMITSASERVISRGNVSGL
jgi:hypothetical protein